MYIRTATLNDLDIITQVESTCFPPNEAATRNEFKERLTSYANHFLLLFEGDTLISFVDGFVTNQNILTDEMYEDATLHNEHGDYQMIFGVNTLPSYQHHGYAHTLLREFIKQAYNEHRKGLILTCKKELIPFYESLGFINQGLSISTHGDVTWYQMHIIF